jgi:hypothetical protein
VLIENHFFREHLLPPALCAILIPVKVLSGGRSLNIKLTLTMLFVFLVSCTGEGSTARPTVDATQRWLNAKCPPQEACAPEESLEDLAFDYLEALIAGNCDQAAGYWLPEREVRAREHCAAGRLLPDKQNEGCQLVGFSSDETSIEQLEQGVSVRISGKYLFECEQETEQYEDIDLILFFEEHEGEWYLAGFNS